MSGNSLRAATVLALLAVARPVVGQARQTPWMPSLGGGTIDWRGSSLATATSRPDPTTAVVMRGSRYIVGRILGFEWGGSYASFKEPQYLDPTQTLALDWRLLGHTPWEGVQPFLGAGPSAFMYGTNSRDRDKFEAGYNVGGGVRVRVTQGLVIIFDARTRWWDRTRNFADEITLSLGFRR